MIGVYGGGVVRARAIIRLIPEARWDPARVLGVQVTSWTENSKFMNDIDEKEDPHELPAVDRQEDGHEELVARRRLKITRKDLQNPAIGVSPHCPRCHPHEQGEHKRAQCHGHTEACRRRVYDALEASGSEKVTNIDPSRAQTRSKPSMMKKRASSTTPTT